MLTPITICYPILPARRSLMAAELTSLFGLGDDGPTWHTVADALELDLRAGDVVLELVRADCSSSAAAFVD